MPKSKEEKSIGAVSYECMSQTLTIQVNDPAPLCIYAWVGSSDLSDKDEPPSGSAHCHIDGAAGTYMLSDAAWPMEGDYHWVAWEIDDFNHEDGSGTCME